MSFQLLQVTVTEVETSHLSETLQFADEIPCVRIDDTEHVPELGGEFTIILAAAEALRSVSTVATKTYVCPATKDAGLMMMRACRFVNAGSMTFKKFSSKPDDSDHVMASTGSSTFALRIMGNSEPAFTRSVEAVTDMAGTESATILTTTSAEATRESTAFVTLSLKMYGTKVVLSAALTGKVFAVMVTKLLRFNTRGKFILSTHGSPF